MKSSRNADDLPGKLAEAHEQRVLFERLLAERSSAADQARAHLDRASTFPTKRRDVELALHRSEADVGWIEPELQQIRSRIRVLEADLALVMADDLELAAAAAARAAKATQVAASTGCRGLTE